MRETKEVSMSRRGAHKTAARLHRGRTFAAQRAFIGLIAGDREIQQRLRLDGKVDAAPASINQSSNRNYAPAGFLDYSNRFLRRAAGCPDIFDHQHVLVGTQSKAA